MIRANVCALIFTFIHAHLCFVVLCVMEWMLGIGMMDAVDREELDWKGRCRCGYSCKWPLPGRDHIHPVMFIDVAGGSRFQTLGFESSFQWWLRKWG